LMSLLFFVNGIVSQSFLPTEFVPNQAILYEASNLNYNMRMNLCDVNFYAGCLFQAYMNFPFEEWSIPNGVYSQYSIIGGDNCNTVLCSNDINSKSPQNCSFYLPKNFTNDIYLVSRAGITVSLSATFSLKINCNAQGTTKFLPYKGGCPVNADVCRQNVRLSEPGSIKTSPDVPVIYSFLLCSVASSFISLEYVLEATNQRSAFATYFCRSHFCNAGQAQTGWFDDSGSSVNTITIGQLNITSLYFAIYGWGDYEHFNSFVFNIQIVDQS